MSINTHIDYAGIHSPDHMQLCGIGNSRGCVLCRRWGPRRRILNRNSSTGLVAPSKQCWKYTLPWLTAGALSSINSRRIAKERSASAQHYSLHEENAELPSRHIWPSCASIMLSLTRAERKYCPIDSTERAPSTLIIARQ